MQKAFACTKCEKNCSLSVVWYGNEITSVTGHQCPLGLDFARSQVIVEKAVVSTTIRVEGAIMPLLPVRTDKPVDKSRTLELIREAGKLVVKAPVRNGQVVARNFCNSGADLVAIKAAEVQ